MLQATGALCQQFVVQVLPRKFLVLQLKRDSDRAEALMLLLADNICSSCCRTPEGSLVLQETGAHLAKRQPCYWSVCLQAGVTVLPFLVLLFN